MKKLVVLLFLFVSLQASEYLKGEYFTPTNDINLSLITHDTRNDKVIYHIERDRYLLRVSSKKLLRLLQQNGYRRFKAKRSYVTFIKLSPINLLPLEQKLTDYFKKNYKKIDIHSIKIIPRMHIDKLPKEFTFKVRSGTLLRSHGTFSIITPKKRQIFFDYYMDATLPVYKSKKKILRGEVLSLRNLTKENVRFERFRALPVQQISGLQAKHHITKGKLLTVRDVERIDLVRRGEFVSVVLKESGLEIDMSAKALQAGTLNDIILIQNRRGKKLRAKVIGKNLVEIKAPR